MNKNSLNITSIDPSKTIPLKRIIGSIKFSNSQENTIKHRQRKETLFSINKKTSTKRFQIFFQKY